MKVNRIEGYRLNNINFESRKNSEIQKPVHTTNPVKAIPVALLIAMSPLNAPVLQAQNTTPANTVAGEVQKRLVVIATYDYKQATPKGEMCHLEFLSKNIDDEAAEKLRLNFIDKRSNYVINLEDSTSRRYNYEHYSVIDINKLETKTITYTYSNGETKEKFEYYACGPGQSYDTPGVYADTKEPLKGELRITKSPELKKRITPEFYNDLKDILGDDVQYTNTSAKRQR